MITTDKNPELIQSLNEFVSALSEGERTTFTSILHSTKLLKSEFEENSSWSQECYTRNCITENERFELLLLCWEEGQYTPIHDHGGEECWVKIIAGEFRETIYKENQEGKLVVVKTTESKAEDMTYMIDFMGYHRLENISKGRSMSLHLYAKPIRNCNIFDEDDGEFVRKDLFYDTI